MKTTIKLFLFAVLLSGTVLADGDMGPGGRATGDMGPGGRAIVTTSETTKTSDKIVVFVAKYLYSIFV